MSEQNNGGPAFPQNLETAMMANLNPSNGALGMTLRDYFAAHAPAVPENWHGGDKGFSSVIEWRWYYADKMIKARG